MESRVSIGWRVGVSIEWRGASPLDREVGSPLNGGLQVGCRGVSGCLQRAKTPFPGTVWYVTRVCNVAKPVRPVLSLLISLIPLVF